MRRFPLSVSHPELVDSFDEFRNGCLASEAFGERLWWRCLVNDDHVWETTVRSRVDGRGCPVCVNQKVVDSNSLATTHPEIAAQWHPTLNSELTPNHIVAGTTRKVWWNCDVADDHIWQAAPETRKQGHGCPYCAGQRVAGSTSLAVTHPELAAQWHPTLNDDLSATDVLAGTHTKIWWKCDVADDHVWSAAGSDRCSGSGCPFCAGQRVAASTSLATTHPEVAAQWHPTLNGDLTPGDVVIGTTKRIWWKCDVADDHVWEAPGTHRKSGSGCPYCANQKVCESNCLATTHPHIALQWHPTLNGDVTARDVIAGSNKKYWWQCKIVDGHAWERSCYNRLRRPWIGCPYC